LDGKSPSHCWPGQVSRAGLTSRYSTLPLCITGKADTSCLHPSTRRGSFFGQARRAVSLQGPTTTARPINAIRSALGSQARRLSPANLRSGSVQSFLGTPAHRITDGRGRP
jgi:hypothetical protein